MASNFTYGEAEMAWTERSEVKVEGGYGFTSPENEKRQVKIVVEGA